MIRPAKQGESELLTKISFESKAYWDYPEEYFDVWESELTIRPDYLEENSVYVFENGEGVVGYYSIVELHEEIELFGAKMNSGLWLEHMFVLPGSIGQGIGTQMFKHLRGWCQSNGVSNLGILADPNSRGFYEKMGCEYLKEFPSTIANRSTPLFMLAVASFD